MAADGRLGAAFDRRRHAHDARLRSAVARLESLSPLAVLGRGYAVCWNADRTRIVRDAATVAVGDRVRVTLESGELDCDVTAAETRRRGATERWIQPSRTSRRRSPSSTTIVKKLEEGDLPLEASLQLYERGVQLSRFCHARLEEAERRIEILNERGELQDRRRRPSATTTTSKGGEIADYIRDAPAPKSTRALATVLPPSTGVPARCVTTRCATASSPAASGCVRSSASPAPMPSAAIARRAARGLRDRADSHLLADSRRPAGHGQRHDAARPADAARRRRRGHGDPRRRRAADRGVRPVAREPRSTDPVVIERKLRVIAVIAAAAGPPAWSAARRSISRASRRAPDGRLAPPLDAEALTTHAREEDRRADPRVGGGRARSWAAAAPRRSTPSILPRPSSGWRFRSSTTSSTSKAPPRSSGKTAGKDAAAGKPTYPALLRRRIVAGRWPPSAWSAPRRRCARPASPTRMLLGHRTVDRRERTN